MSKISKYVIYTAMVGGYDEVMQPLVVDERFDYVLFSNDIDKKKIGVWDVRTIPYENDDNTRMCRFVKTHPKELLGEYEISIWMDSNIQILTSQVYKRIMELSKSNVLIASMNHFMRNCIYDEAFEIMCLRYDDERKIVEWCHKIKKEKYPYNNGLFETNVVFRKHNLDIISNLNLLWWYCIDNYSKRDQLSFNYALWKIGLHCACFFEKSLCARNSPDMFVREHKDESKKTYPMKKSSWLMKYCWKRPQDKIHIKKHYDRIYSMFCPHFWLYLLGQYYRAKEILRALVVVNSNKK